MARMMQYVRRQTKEHNRVLEELSELFTILAAVASFIVFLMAGMPHH